MLEIRISCSARNHQSIGDMRQFVLGRAVRRAKYEHSCLAKIY